MKLSDHGYERFDLNAASQLIAQGLAEDEVTVDACDIADQLIACLRVRNHDCRVAIDGEAITVPTPCLFDQYDFWVVRIAALTETFIDEQDVQAGAWPGETLVNTNAALKTIQQVVFGLIETQSGLLNPEDGVTVLEVIARSLASGESLAQSRSRALYDSRGLRIALHRKPRAPSMRNLFNA